MMLSRKPAVLLSVAALALTGGLIPQVATGAAGATRPSRVADTPVAEVRSFPTGELGVARPTGLAWSAKRGALLVPRATRTGTAVVAMTPDSLRLGRTRIAGLSDGGTLAVDPTTGAVTGIDGGSLLSRTGAKGAVPQGFGSPDAASYDELGNLFVLDGAALVRQKASGGVTRTQIQGTGHDLRGLASDADTGLHYTFDAATDDVLGLDDNGRVMARHDASSLKLVDVVGLAIGPSADGTDDPGVQSLFLADAGPAIGSGSIVEATLAPVPVVASIVAPTSLVRTVETSAFNPASPDPSGVAFLPANPAAGRPSDRLLIADGEVDEMTIFEGVNLFETSTAGSVTNTGVSQPWSNEPVGSGFNPTNNHLFISSDDQKEVFEIVAGGDGRYGTADDTVTSFDTAGSGNNDPEGLDYDPVTNSIWTTDGVDRQVFQYRAGADGRVGTADDVRSNFDVGVYGATDPEGLAYDPARDTILVLDDGSRTIYELSKSGALLNTIPINVTNGDQESGLAVGARSTGSGRSYYIVDRGVDNDTDPNENDGRMYEITATLPPIGGGNQPPSVDAGVDQSLVLPASATLNGTVTDDGQPNPPGAVTTTWSMTSGPGGGVVTFGNAGAVDTTASFSVAGTYVLRLSANDGGATSADELTVNVSPVGGSQIVDRRVAAGSDDVEQAVTGFVGLTSSDLELTVDGTTQQVVGTRFTSLQVPNGATITNAYVQFRTDEVSTGVVSLTVRAENADNTPTYQAVSGSVTSRATTSASVAWAPPAWNTVGEVGAGQRTPNLAAPIQAVVNRTGWVQGNALALQFSGTGRRTAEAFEGGATFAPLLHVEFTTGGAGPTNQPPVVNAGADASVTLPATASLDGTVTDDGLPTPPGAVTTTWTGSGPGTVTFGNAAAVDTTASFSAAGTYVLRLTANDSALSSADDVTITVLPAGGGGTQTVERRVAAGSDDAEQVASGSVGLTSSDLELAVDGTTQQVVGTRFTSLQVPRGATITNAYVQFRTDEVSTGAVSLTVRAENADNTPTYLSASGNVTSRALTAATVPWAPPAWNTVGEAGVGQRTPNIAALVQAVISRAGWNPGNALALQFSGTGRRTAEAFEGGATFAPLLHVEYTGGGGPVTNQQPVVSAGADATVTLPGTAALDGTVTDDGLPNPPAAVTTTWSQVSGPGVATFGSATSVDTTASFSAAGTYVLQLTANDSALSGSDTVTITVQAAGGGGAQTVERRVATGSDDVEQAATGSVGLTSTDLELAVDGSNQQVIGTRFTSLQVPAGATITNAYVQFRTDEVSTGASSLTVRAENADNTPTYQAASGNVTSRALTAASVPWAPPAWNTIGEAAVGQRTSNIASLVQAVVSRPGWVQGNALALQFTGPGTRVAESFEGGATFAPLLHIEFTTG